MDLESLGFQLLLLLATGAVAGLLSGLFGIGGGLIMVPALAYILPVIGVPPESVMQTALGTSLAVIACHSIASTRTHHQLRGVLWAAWRGLVPGLVLGSLGGAYIAQGLSEITIKRIVAAASVVLALQLILDWKPKVAASGGGTAGLMAGGGIIGGVSALIGIGGGALTVPFLMWRGAEIRQAVATSAACGAVLAVAGTVGFVLTGIRAGTTGANSIGFVSIPAFAGLALASVGTSRIGARLAHRLPELVLKRCFASFLVVIAVVLILE